jgi:hypothetical protein
MFLRCNCILTRFTKSPCSKLKIEGRTSDFRLRFAIAGPIKRLRSPLSMRPTYREPGPLAASRLFQRF